MAAFGRKLGAAEVGKTTDKLLDDGRRKKLGEMIAGGTPAAAAPAAAKCGHFIHE